MTLKFKEKLAEALLLDLDSLLPTLFQEPRLSQIRGELAETLRPEWFVGIFAVATREFKHAKVLDVRLRFGLRAIRLHDLVKTELGPKRWKGGEPSAAAAQGPKGATRGALIFPRLADLRR